MPVGIIIRLSFCGKCNQMTNHSIENHYYPECKQILTCLKCKVSKVVDKNEFYENVENIIEDCVIIKIKDVPKHMVGIDLTWLDKEIAKIKQRLLKRLT